MLSKHKFLSTKSLLVAAGIATCGLASIQQSANAIALNFLNKVGDNYTYELEVFGQESVDPGYTLEFSGMTGVISNSVSDFASLFFEATSTTDSTAIFTATGGIAPSGTLTLPTFTIESTSQPDQVNWDFLDSGGNPIAGDFIDGPAIASVPFEFSPGLGLILSGTLLGALKLRSKFGKKAEINF
ncbi:MAG: hypothetical protein AB4368_27480 [Xenococcaceae cyanobacterium]